MIPTFPRAAYKALLTNLFPPGSTVLFDGDPEVFLPPLEGYDTPVTVRCSIGDVQNNGTSETRQCWDAEAQGGDGAWAYWSLDRVVWPVTIYVETLSSEFRGEDFLMVTRNKLRWKSSILAIENMELTTVHLSNVQVSTRMEMGAPNITAFGAALLITHGQCIALLQTDNDGSVIDRITSIPGVLKDGVPSPLDVDMGPVSSS